MNKAFEIIATVAAATIALIVVANAVLAAGFIALYN